MKTRAILFALIAMLLASPAFALYSVSNRGIWPESWPKEMEPLRDQSKTLVGPTLSFRHHVIPFKDREEFEAAWPQILKVKSPGAPIILVQSPKNAFFVLKPGGVCIHSPPENSTQPEQPIKTSHVKQRWMWTTYIELAVDGEIVDLNRLKLPADTPIIDLRFEKATEVESSKKAPSP